MALETPTQESVVSTYNPALIATTIIGSGKVDARGVVEPIEDRTVIGPLSVVIDGAGGEEAGKEAAICLAQFFQYDALPFIQNAKNRGEIEQGIAAMVAAAQQYMLQVPNGETQARAHGGIATIAGGFFVRSGSKLKLYGFAVGDAAINVHVPGEQTLREVTYLYDGAIRRVAEYYNLSLAEAKYLQEVMGEYTGLGFMRAPGKDAAEQARIDGIRKNVAAIISKMELYDGLAGLYAYYQFLDKHRVQRSGQVFKPAPFDGFHRAIADQSGDPLYLLEEFFKRRHIIQQEMGSTISPAAHIYAADIPQDVPVVVSFCSDGPKDNLRDQELHQLMLRGGDMQERSLRVANAAKTKAAKTPPVLDARSKPDDMSMISIDCTPPILGFPVYVEIHGVQGEWVVTTIQNNQAVIVNAQGEQIVVHDKATFEQICKEMVLEAETPGDLIRVIERIGVFPIDETTCTAAYVKAVLPQVLSGQLGLDQLPRAYQIRTRVEMLLAQQRVLQCSSLSEIWGIYARDARFRELLVVLAPSYDWKEFKQAFHAHASRHLLPDIPWLVETIAYLDHPQKSKLNPGESWR